MQSQNYTAIPIDGRAVRINVPNAVGGGTTPVLLDQEDLELVGPWKWRVTPAGYVMRVASVHGKSQGVYLHRLILGLQHKDGKIADHINRVRHDNRRENLRVVTHSQNNWNSSKRSSATTSQYKGVSWATREQRWIVQIGGMYYASSTSEHEAGLLAALGRMLLAS